MTSPSASSEYAASATKQPRCLWQRKVYSLFKRLSNPPPVVSVIRLSGIIASGGGLFRTGLSLMALEEEINRAFAMRRVKAVALQVNSPGGSPVQSELIYRRIRALSEEKKIPVLTFVEDVGASGGYWLACAGEEIFALESSIVGSIGVISAGFGYTEAIRRLGIERRVYMQGENKDLLDPFQPEKEEDVAILQRAQAHVHEHFKQMVRKRRAGKLKTEEENRLFSGEFWVGSEALELGLIDGIGDMQGILRLRYGDEVVFHVVSKSKGRLRRKLGLAMRALAEAVMDSAMERLLWARFGR